MWLAYEVICTVAHVHEKIEERAKSIVLVYYFLALKVINKICSKEILAVYLFFYLFINGKLSKLFITILTMSMIPEEYCLKIFRPLEVAEHRPCTKVW